MSRRDGAHRLALSMERWVEREKRWDKRHGDYMTRFQGAFQTPAGNVRRCGHWHESYVRANACAAMLENAMWRDARRL